MREEEADAQAEFEQHTYLWEEAAQHGWDHNWISVDEEMPPRVEGRPARTQGVIVTDGCGVYFGWYDYEGEKWWHNQITSHITHWMPVPDPPKQG